MEQYIESRVILGLLCLIHLFLSYAGSTGACHGHINRKALNYTVLAELILVTAYVIYDNLQTPPYNGWFIAIVGYVFVYGMICMTWATYCIYALLDKDKAYEMTINSHVRLQNEDYFKGVVIEQRREIEVLLPYLQNLVPKNDKNKKPKVKFQEVLHGRYIIVTQT